VYFRVITHAYHALSKHAHSCSGIKWENLAAMKTLKAPSVSSPEPAHWLYTVCVKHRLFVRLFVSLSVVSVKGVHPMGGTNRDASQKFKGGGIKSGINQ